MGFYLLQGHHKQDFFRVSNPNASIAHATDTE